MRQLTYRLTFHTPAFLGNAEQVAQWRTPPIKALLRQWWRVAFAASVPAASVVAMRDAEGRLFGCVGFESELDKAGQRGEPRRSEVRLRLAPAKDSTGWRLGTLKSWEGLEQRPVDHDEVERAGRRVGPHAYLGFGPLTVEGRATVLTKGRAAIQAGDSAELRLAAPEDEVARLVQALSLIDRFGTLGGRSRNGWGSISVAAANDTSALPRGLDTSLTLPWKQALRTDWPQAIGADDRGPLVWQTSDAVPDWKSAMRRLAEIKIGLRTRFRLPSDRPDGLVHDRHWLSYPMTNHKVRAWDSAGLRLPNSLRFKVCPDGAGTLKCLIFHMPCLPPPAFRPDRSAIERVWQQVHAHLDAIPSLARSSA
jgi:CRISPR-associated protein Cmr1